MIKIFRVASRGMGLPGLETSLSCLPRFVSSQAIRTQHLCSHSIPLNLGRCSDVIFRLLILTFSAVFIFTNYVLLAVWAGLIKQISGFRILGHRNVPNLLLPFLFDTTTRFWSTEPPNPIIATLHKGSGAVYIYKALQGQYFLNWG